MIRRYALEGCLRRTTPTFVYLILLLSETHNPESVTDNPKKRPNFVNLTKMGRFLGDLRWSRY